MNLITENLILRDYVANDLDNYFKLKSCAKVWEYSSFIPLKHLSQAEVPFNSLLLENKKNVFCALLKQNTNEYIGEAGIIGYNSNANRCEIGYNLLPEYWNHGYATEIVKELISYSFQELKVERIEALVLESNIASRKVLEKNKFHLEGVLRNFNKYQDGYRNVCYYGLITSDLKVFLK